MNQVYTLKRTTTKTFLLVGFERSIFDIMTPPPGSEADFYFCEKINNGFQAYQWLITQHENDANMPHSIIVNYDFLVKEEFQFLEQLKTNITFSSIPFIVIGKAGIAVDKVDLLRRGVDDYYPGKVSSLDFQNRVAAIRRYKKQLQFEVTKSSSEQFEFKMPTGKRLFDIVFSLSIIIALSPLLLFLALAIKLTSKGPVIYRSKRVGTGYQVFDFLKFRSMCQGADKKINELSHLNHYTGENGNGTFMKINNDPRVTAIGKIIRKTSLDELPQLFNVLRGEMSIVGNRPLPLYEAEQMTTDEWSQRFWAPAGITGLWQTSGKGKDNMSVDERVGLDIEYANSFSFLMDATILTKTPFAMLQKEK